MNYINGGEGSAVAAAPMLERETVLVTVLPSSSPSDIVRRSELLTCLNCAIFAVLLSSFDDNNSVGEAQILQTDFFIIFAGAWDGAP